MAVYDPREVTLRIAGLVVDGYASGEKITLNMLGEGSRAEVGSDGEPVLVVSHDRRAELTFRLYATGAGRSTCSALMTAYNTAPEVAVPVTLTSNSTGENLVALQALIKRYPNVVYGGDTAPVREFTMVMGRLRSQQTPDPIDEIIPAL